MATVKRPSPSTWMVYYHKSQATFLYSMLVSSINADAGMLSKSKGQTLRLAAAMHALFHWETPANIPEAISTPALKAALSLIDACVQHACFLAGRKDIKEEIDSIVDEGISLSIYLGDIHHL